MCQVDLHTGKNGTDLLGNHYGKEHGLSKHIFFELVKLLAEGANIVFSISEIYCFLLGFVLEATSNTTPCFVCKQHYKQLCLA